MRAFFFHPLAQSICAATLCLATLAVWLLFVQDEKSILRNSQLRLENEQLLSQSMERDAAGAHAVIERYDRNLEEIAYFRKNFLTQRNARVLEISRFLPAKARELSIGIEEIRYQSAAAKNQNFEVYQIELPLSGYYRDIRTYIEAIEQSGLFLVITQLGLEGENEGTVQMQLSLATFFEARNPPAEVNLDP